MAIQRQNIIRGPAIVTYDSEVYYSEDDIIVTPNIETMQIPSSVNGNEDERLVNITHEITFTPVGKWSHVKKLLNTFATPVIGGSIFGSTDKDLVINTVGGQKITYKAAAITSLPQVRFSSVNRLLGSVTFTAIGANNTAFDNAAKRIVQASEAFNDDSHDPDDVLTQAYSVAWGSTAPFDALETEDGVTVSFNLSLQPVQTDRDGIVDMTVENVEVMAMLTPVGLSEANMLTLMKLQGTGVQRGASLGAMNSNDLVITGTGVYAAIYGAAPKQGPMRFGRTVLRSGQVGFVATRRYDDGALEPLYLLADAAPE